MVNKPDKNVARLRRHRRVRGKISGTAAVPPSGCVPLLQAHLCPADRRRGRRDAGQRFQHG